MFPTGDFDRLKYQVMEWYNEESPITFGILESVHIKALTNKTIYAII